MNNAGELSYKRDPLHDYSALGTYHHFLETANNEEILGSESKGVMTLNECGEAFLAVLGMALQHFSCLRILAMETRPDYVERAGSADRQAR